MRFHLLALPALLVVAAAGPAQALDLIALNNRNELVMFTDKAPGKAKTLPLTGVSGKLIGIDLRPADKTLYGLGSDGAIYTINTSSGAAAKKSSLSVPLEAIDYVIVDFNPQADRMRIIGSTGQSLRVNVDTGQAIVDGKLNYRAGDANAGKPKGVYAGAYINSYAGAKQTQLFEIDSVNGVYITQDPPNDGVLRTVGPTGLPKGTIVTGLDIYTDAKDEYFGFAVAGGTLYSLDVGVGKMKRLGNVGDGQTALIDVAVATIR